MSSIKTTVRTSICSFTEYRIYPGKGRKYVAQDGKVYLFFNSKVRSLAKQEIKPYRLVWTQAWRRKNRKMKSDTSQRKRVRKSYKIEKAIVGLSLEELRRKRVVKHDTNKVTRDQAIEEAKSIKQKIGNKKQNNKLSDAGFQKKDAQRKANISKNIPSVSHKSQMSRKK